MTPYEHGYSNGLIKVGLSAETINRVFTEAQKKFIKKYLRNIVTQQKRRRLPTSIQDWHKSDALKAFKKKHPTVEKFHKLEASKPFSPDSMLNPKTPIQKTQYDKWKDPSYSSWVRKARKDYQKADRRRHDAYIERQIEGDSLLSSASRRDYEKYIKPFENLYGKWW